MNNRYFIRRLKYSFLVLVQQRCVKLFNLLNPIFHKNGLIYTVYARATSISNKKIFCNLKKIFENSPDSKSVTVVNKFYFFNRNDEGGSESCFFKLESKFFRLFKIS